MKIYTNWDDVRNKPFTKWEEIYLGQLFTEYLEGNGLVEEFEDMNQPEFDNYFEVFKHGYLMCRLMDKK